MSGEQTISKLVEINKLLKEAISTQDWTVKFVYVDLQRACIPELSDSSWANADQLKSQSGYLVFLADKACFEPQGGAASLLEWRSHRIKRTCRSTLAAETMGMDAGMDAGMFARELIAEIIIKSYVPTQSGKLPEDFIPVHAITDCRSLYDILTKDGQPGTATEKRLIIDIQAIKENAEEFDAEMEKLKDIFRWIPTTKQLGDHLTKAKPPWMLRSELDRNWLNLVATPEEEAAEINKEAQKLEKEYYSNVKTATRSKIKNDCKRALKIKNYKNLW